MSVRAPGAVDYRQGEFAARFQPLPEILARVKAIQRRRYHPTNREWLVGWHHRSAAVLRGLALEHGWRVTPAAHAQFTALDELAESFELSVRISAGKCSEPWVVFKVADDDVLRRKVIAVPGAVAEGPDDAYWIPCLDESLKRLLEIVECDERIEVDPRAWRLLEGIEELPSSDLYPPVAGQCDADPPAAATLLLPAMPPLRAAQR